jgi:hypothetical protein
MYMQVFEKCLKEMFYTSEATADEIAFACKNIALTFVDNCAFLLFKLLPFVPELMFSTAWDSLVKQFREECTLFARTLNPKVTQLSIQSSEDLEKLEDNSENSLGRNPEPVSEHAEQKASPPDLSPFNIIDLEARTHRMAEINETVRQAQLWNQRQSDRQPEILQQNLQQSPGYALYCPPYG